MKLTFTKEEMQSLPGMMTTIVNGKPKFEFANDYFGIDDGAKAERQNVYDALRHLDSTQDRAVFVATIEALIDAKINLTSTQMNAKNGLLTDER